MLGELYENFKIFGRVYSRKQGQACDFSEKGQKIFKKAKQDKIFENLGKNVQNLKRF